MSRRGNRGRGKNNRQTAKPTNDTNTVLTTKSTSTTSHARSLDNNNNNNNDDNRTWRTRPSPTNMAQPQPQPPTQPQPHTRSRASPHPHHGSAMPVPTTRRHRARRSGLHAQQIQQSLYESSFRRPTSGSIERLKPGAPYDECHSFFSASSCDEIFHELTLALKCQPDLDVTVHASGYKIRGRKFVHHIMCEFQIEMFDTTAAHAHYPNHILVEFQRRNGDGFVFERFLHDVFSELAKTKLVTATKYTPQSPQNLSPTPLSEREEAEEEDDEKLNDVEDVDANNGFQESDENTWRMDGDDENTLRMLLATLFDATAHEVEMRRTAASFVANRIVDNTRLVHEIVRYEPHIITKFSDLLLKCVDPQIVRCIGVILYHMFQQSDKLKHEALKLNVKTVCEKVYKRWTEPVEKRYGSNHKYVIRVIPSLQVAQRMHACIEVLE